MYNSGEEEYLKATRDAQINTYVEKSDTKERLLFTNMLLLLALIVIGFLYFTKGNNYLSENIFGKKTAVLGVSHRSMEADYSDEELVDILSNATVDVTQESKRVKQQEELSKEMSQLTDESSLKSESSYESAIAQELNGKIKGVKGRVVLVKQGDTLSSLAEKYYGDSMAFQEIIAHNKNITEESQKLYVGQKITIPY